MTAGDHLQSRPPEYGETRPWGSFRRLVHDQPCTVKLMTVNPGERLSLQSHEKRSELWLFLDPGATVEIDGVSSHPAVGDTVFVPLAAKHRLSASPSGPVRLIEMTFGTFDESDITRYDDIYGRS
jgi:mannose-6-phosphate isomerase